MSLVDTSAGGESKLGKASSSVIVFVTSRIGVERN